MGYKQKFPLPGVDTTLELFIVREGLPPPKKMQNADPYHSSWLPIRTM